MKLRNFSALPLAAIAGLALTATSAHAAVITINNADFELATDPLARGNWATVVDWTEESAGSVFIDDNGSTWVPDSDRSLYIGGGSAAVNQDLSHNWSATDSYTVGITGMNPSWSTGQAEFKVQLREVDGTVLWDTGTIDVTGTVTGSPASYTGTGHIHSWTIDASTFAGVGDAVEGSPINIRIASVNGTTYLDDVSLNVDVIPEPSTAVLLGLGGFALLRRRR